MRKSWLRSVALLWPIVVLVIVGAVYLTTAQSEESSRADAKPTKTALSPVAVQPPAVQTPRPASTSNATISALGTLTVSDAFVAGYVRALYGDGWQDPDHNGCDARNDILKRDLTAVTFRAGTHDCVVSTGILLDPYTGDTIDFIRGNTTSTLVQIDHIVPLGWAWQHGAASWTPAERLQFANDPVELLAVDGKSNEEKSDYGPARWLPSNVGYRCTYIEKFVFVLNSYSLSIDSADKDTIIADLQKCAG